MISGNPADHALLAALLPAEERSGWLGDAQGDGSMSRGIERLHSLLALAGVRVGGSDDALELLLAHRAGLRPPERADFDDTVADVASRLPDGERVLARWQQRCSRMATLDAQLPAEAHFERLSGRSATPGRTAEPARVLRLWPARRWAVAAVVLTLVAAGTIGTAAEDPDARAAWESVEARRSVRTRGPSTGIGPLDWAAEASRARSRRLGLWPVYDTERLAALEQEVLDSEASSPQSLLVLGEIRLMRGDREAGLVALRAAASTGNEEARALLQRIE